MDKTWFELKEVRRRRLADAVWIPLRTSEVVEIVGEHGYPGFKEEFFGIGSVAIPLDRRADAQKLGWTDLSHNQDSWAEKDFYKPADVYQAHQGVDLGVELVLAQHFETEDRSEWHLHQDLVVALGLLREGDVWVRPKEDYSEVARLRRNVAGNPVALEIKNEFLRDYLCARNMLLRTAMFRSRQVVVEDVAEAGSPEGRQEKIDGEEFELRVLPMIEGVLGGDGSFAVFRAGRNDVDPDEDVPNPGPETSENTVSEQWHGKHEGRDLVRVIGELWRQEDIEPAVNSIRVRRDKVATGLHYIVDASGEVQTSEQLNDESKMRWLWFQPEIITAITKRRSGSFRWYTQETGGVGFSTAGLTHFGINKLGLVNVYAYDIAKLPVWQQRVWAGYNVAPEGGVSAELVSAQARAIVAKTHAPECILPQSMAALDEMFCKAIGAPLLRQHAATDKVLNSVSRFRALEPEGVYALAKDLMRLIADRIDTVALQKVVPPPRGEKWRSIKSLEKYLATLVTPDRARGIDGPLAGAYDLRLADAHLPAEELNKAFALVRVDPKAPPLEQGFWLIVAVVETLNAIGRIMVEQHEKVQRGQS